MNNQFLKILIFSLLLIFPAFSARAVNPFDVVINEIAWMGMEVSYNDEWIVVTN